MKGLLILLLSLLLQGLLSAVAALAGWSDLRVEPGLVILAFSAMAFSPAVGGVIAAILGLSTDLMSLSPLGLHALVFSLVFFVGRAVINWLGLRSASSVLPIVLLMSLLARVLFAGALALFTEQPQPFAHPLVHLLGAFIDALFTLPLWPLLWGLHRWGRADDALLGGWRLR